MKGKSAVVLSGGGAYGAYEVGVLKALVTGKSPATKCTPLKPNIYTGTSVGSFNASIMVSKGEIDPKDAVEYLERVWRNKISDSMDKCNNGVFRFRPFAPLEFANPACYAKDPLRPFDRLAKDMALFAEESTKRISRFISSSESLPRRSLEMVNLSAAVSIEPFRSLIRKVIDLPAIRRSKQELVVVTTNMKKGEPELYDNKEMTDERGHDVVQASAAVPGFFPAVKIDGTLHLDGGITMNTPIDPAIDRGADELHIVYMDPDIDSIPLRRLDNTLDVLDRVIVTTFASTMNRDIENAININKGLNLIEKAKKSPRQEVSTLDDDRDALLSVLDSIFSHLDSQPRRKLTIHRYNPDEDLGGVVGVLNFDRAKTIDLIKRGYDDAVAHNCEKNKCGILGH